MLAAEIEQYVGSLARAELHLERAEEALARLGPDWPHRELFDQSRVRLRAKIANGRGLPDEAARVLAEGLARARERGDGGAIAELEVERANLRLSAQQHELLERETAAALARPELAAEGAAWARASLALCLATSLAVRARSDPALWSAAEERLRAVAADPGARASDARRARVRLAEVLLTTGRLDEARALLAGLSAEAALLGGALPRDEEHLRAWLEVRRARAEARDEDGLAAALDVSERGVERLLAGLAAEPPREGGLGLLHFGETRALLGEHLELLDAVYGPSAGAEQALALLVRVQALGSRARRAGWGAVPNEELRAALLGPDEGLLVYLPAIGASHVLAVDRAGSRRFALAPVERLNQAREALDAVFEPLAPPAAWTAEAAALCALLLPEPLLERIGAWTALSIVGLDLLRPVPFEHLPLADGTPFGERFALGYLPALPLGVALAGRAPPARAADAADLVLVAAPRFDPDDPESPPALELGPRALERLTRGAERPLVVTGPDATPAALAGPAVRAARALHVLTHGAADRGHSAGLALAGGAALWAEDVEELPGVPPLVILSVCRAARGPGRLGEGGLEGLAGALLEHGAQCVLLSFEDVELAEALELAELVQPLVLQRGLSPAEALRRARKERAERRPDAPAAAPLQAFGLAQRPLR